MNKTAGITLLLFLGTFFTLIYFCDRGFNITDEGNYLTSSQYPEENLTLPSSYFYINGFFFRSLQYNVFLFRIIGLILLACSGLFLGYGLSRMLSSTETKSSSLPMTILCMSFSGLGSLLYYSWGLLTPSYNSLTATLLTTFAGLTSLTLDTHLRRSKNTFNQPLLIIGSGACITLTFFAKFPVGIAILVIYCLWLYRLKLTKYWLVLVSTISFFSILYFIFVQQFPQWQKMFENSLTLISLDNHVPSQLFKYYVYCLKYFILSKQCFYFGFGAIFFLLLYEYTPPKIRPINTLVSTILFAFLVNTFIRHGYFLDSRAHRHFIIQFYVLWFILLTSYLLILVLINYLKKLKNPLSTPDTLNLILFELSLLILTFLGCIGTNNSLVAEALLYSSPLLAAFLILYAQIIKFPQTPFFAPSIIVIISFYTCIQVISGTIFTPYDINSNLLKQTVPTIIGSPPSSLKLDPATSRFMNDIKTIAFNAGFKPGDDILVFYDMPGIVYILGGKSPATSWWLGKWVKNYKKFNESSLSFIDHQRLKHAFIVQNIPDTSMPSLQKFDIKFPNDYQLCGELVWPMTKQHVRLWRPKK